MLPMSRACPLPSLIRPNARHLGPEQQGVARRQGATGPQHAQAASLSSGSNPSRKAGVEGSELSLSKGSPHSTSIEAPWAGLRHRSPARPRAQVSPCAKACICPMPRGCRVMPTHLPTVLPDPPVLPKPNGFAPVTVLPRQHRLRSSSSRARVPA